MKIKTLLATLITTAISCSLLYAQEAAAAPAHAATKESFLEVIKKGGWVMYPIGICSAAMIWLIVDIWMKSSKKNLVPEADATTAQNAFRAGDYLNAYQAMKAGNSPYCEVVRGALSSVGHGKAATEDMTLSTIEKVNARFQTKINYLSVIGVCTPMIGLLGTVSGMMSAFATLGTSGVGDPSALSAHIGEVLVATASGLFIAIPAFMSFYFLKNKLLGSMHYLEEEISKLFHNLPYEYLVSTDVGQEETFAAVPYWLTEGQGAPEGEVPAEG